MIKALPMSEQRETSQDALPRPVADYVAAYNLKDIGKMVEQLDDGVSFLHVMSGETKHALKGRDAFAELARSSASMFISRRQEVVSSSTRDGRTVLHVQFNGVIASDLSNGWVAGQEIDVSGVSIFTVAGEKITEIIDVA
ncbi:hypothetical protein B5K05_23985 [Rhizobium phaseoli]|nr:SnoaL domain-containing protein [Rhizobium phaseoli Ch24-10]RDJ04728.1 hypothetical protein B5K04_23920 [Rhizobium phaseoli]RDJ06981.1 hypothetical protein B5K05_23985 [Rhizobium phaseoli]